MATTEVREPEVSDEEIIEEAPVPKSARAHFYGNDLSFRSEMRGVPERRCVRQMDPNSDVAARFEMREVPDGTGGSSLLFTGYASVVERGYEMQDMFGAFTETIARSAFDKTLSEKADVNFLTNHGGITMARTKPGTLKLASDMTGLYAEARLNPTRSDVQIIRAAVEDGDLDEMSFAFRVTRQEWDEAYENRRILEVNMHQGDVSIVNFGANPATAGTVSLRSRFADEGITTSALAGLFQELRAGATLSAASSATLKHVLSLAATADTAVDELQAVLSQFLGVPNPDEDEDEDEDEVAESAAGEIDEPAASTQPTRHAFIPDYTTTARQRLAALAERSR